MPEIFFAPLQGYTDYRFRNAFSKYFEGVDVFLTPYIRLKGDWEIKASVEKDFLPENNTGIRVLPQIMTRDGEEFLYLLKYLKRKGFSEVNWNLGCPYPMVVKRGLGSGLLAEPEKIDEILQKVTAESDMQISVKMRLGYTDKFEFRKVLPILEKYSLQHLTIHPRIGKQLYKGKVDLLLFEECLKMTEHKLVYNGDITTFSSLAGTLSGRDFWDVEVPENRSNADLQRMALQSYKVLNERFVGVDSWMLGRGLIANPFLSEMIKTGNESYPEDWLERFRSFHDDLYASYSESLSGARLVLIKMYSFWEYFALSFRHSPKCLKKIKKARQKNEYEAIVEEVFRIEERGGDMS